MSVKCDVSIVTDSDNTYLPSNHCLRITPLSKELVAIELANPYRLIEIRREDLHDVLVLLRHGDMR